MIEPDLFSDSISYSQKSDLGSIFDYNIDFGNDFKDDIILDILNSYGEVMFNLNLNSENYNNVFLGEIDFIKIAKNKVILNYFLNSYQYYGRGFMKNSLEKIIDYSFLNLDISHFGAEVSNSNLKSIKVLEYCNFKKESNFGSFSSYYFKNK